MSHIQPFSSFGTVPIGPENALVITDGHSAICYHVPNARPFGISIARLRITTKHIKERFGYPTPSPYNSNDRQLMMALRDWYRSARQFVTMYGTARTPDDILDYMGRIRRVFPTLDLN